MQGYYQFPTIYNDQVVFTCEDDLWTVNRHGGVARRLTVSKGAFYHPYFSPDGKLLAFTGEEEGRPEVYIMPAEGAPPKRLTFLDSESFVVGWHPILNKIIFASNSAQPFNDIFLLYMIAVEGGIPEPMPAGLATSISFGPNAGKVILRNMNDLAHWKRYRGGMTGDIWIDSGGKGKFRRLFKLNGNVTQPRWIGERIYFISDHLGVGNIFSCNLKGKDIQSHTNYQDFYVRYINNDGKRIVYQLAADLYYLDLESAHTQKIEFEYHSSMPQRGRKFVSPRQHLADYDLHPKGQAVTFTSRGKAFSMFNWEGGVFQHAQSDGIRYRLPRWLNSKGRLVMLSDASGEEALEIHQIEIQNKVDRLENLDIGRALGLEISPKADLIAVTNHRMELLLVDLAKRELRVLDQSTAGAIGRPSWSPDGKWLVYSKAISLHIRAIYLCEVGTGKIHPVTNPVLLDLSPSFDPGGKYIYFLSYRSFNPIADNLHFEISFPLGIRPYLITLKKDTVNPFKQKSPDLADILGETTSNSSADQADDKEEKDSDASKDKSDEKSKKESDSAKSSESKEVKVEIDLEGIENRVVPFPVPDGRYSQITGVDGNKVLFIVHPVEWLLDSENDSDAAGAGNLKMYDFESKKVTSIKDDVSSFRVARDYKSIIYRSGGEIRVVGVDDKDLDKSKSGTEYTKKSGWIDVNRAKISVVPQEEWRQMFREAWRLQRDYFWTEDMSGVNWEMVYRQYLPLVDRIGTRSEMADLLLEMQGELGTSHAFEWGGDYRYKPRYNIGFLGADLKYNQKAEGYEIVKIIRGDSWDDRLEPPLSALGKECKEGDVILAINGQKLSPTMLPNQVLINHAGNEVHLTLLRKKSRKTEILCVKTIAYERILRYRNWVETNRARVHQATDGRVGYVHIPDMSGRGYAEFHRYFLAELDREGLIVDVRFNRGGYVSQLILEKLARRRLGYDKRRWGVPIPYPQDSLAGPIVVIANEFSASDGDIFAHSFKLMKLGPVVGKRTWGGVIGYSFHSTLVDGSVTTQPEYSFWFEDIGWQLENYGTEPDIEVEITPQDYVKKRDPQLAKSIQVILEQLHENPPRIPDFSNRPKIRE